MKTYKDISSDIGQLSTDNNPKHPMYSFDRASYNFWQGFYDGLRSRKFTHKQAIAEMQSKGVRWMLDDESQKLQELGFEMAKSYVKCSDC